MRTHARLARFAALLLPLVVAAPATRADVSWDPAKVPTPALRAIEKVSPTKLTLKNGITVFLLEDHTFPVVEGTAYVTANPTWIPDDKVGLGGLTGEVMRTGGTAQHPGDALDDRLAAIGASIETSYDGQELAQGSFRALSDNTPEVLGLFADVLRHPAFPDDKIELAKVGLRRSIATRNDELIPLLVRVARQAVYGKNSVWARQAEYATVEAIHREDCEKLYREIFEPSRMVLAVYGDFHAKDMEARLAADLGDWKGAGIPLPPKPPVPTETKPRLVFAPKEDVTQSGILLAGVGFMANDPDFPAMDVYQTALGGGFQSRLVNRIRTQRGLAYATGAGAGEGYQKPGVFIAYSLTKSESTLTAAGLVRDEVKKSLDAPFTPEETQIARSTVENTFVFKFEQPSEVLDRIAYYQAIGFPQDFLQRYQAGLKDVTAESMLAAARRKVHPGQLVAVLVGREKDFDKSLDSYGLPVERVDVTIPPPPSRRPAHAAAGPHATETARQWLRDAGKLAGGTTAWAKVTSVQLEQTSHVTMNGQSLDVSSSLKWRLPDRILAVQKYPFGEARTGYDGVHGWSSMGPQTKDEPQMPAEIQKEYERSLFHLLGHPDDLAIEAEPELQTIDGVAYHVADVKSDKVTDLTLYFGPDGALARVEYLEDGPTGPSHQTEVFTDWQPAGAIRYPRGRKVLLDGKPYIDAQITSVVLDAPLEPATFKKPGS